MKLFLILALLMLAALAFGHASSNKVVFRVVDYQTSHGQRTALLQPVLSYDLFGYLKDNSAEPTRGEVIRCETSKRDIGKTPEGGEMSVLTLDCGAISLDVAGINFKQ